MVRACLALVLLCAALCADCAGLYRRFDASWKLTFTPGSKGCGAAIIPDNIIPAAPTDWVEPNIRGALAVGFDTNNPKADNIFDANGNIYDRPQREISLHWNGREIANRLCGEPLNAAHSVTVSLILQYVTGGADLTIKVNDRFVFDRFFVPGLHAYHGSLVFGGEATAANVRSRWSLPMNAQAAPTRVAAITDALNDKNHHRISNEVDFPPKSTAFGRVICTLTLDETPSGLDPWDRVASVYLYDSGGERFEILRYITPYRRAWTWKADVTDFLPLLTGRKRLEVECETYGAGWLVSVDFDFYPGRLDRIPYKVVNLWNVTTPIGDDRHPFNKVVAPIQIMPDRGAAWSRIRVCVTGHGMSPNTGNAAEFLPLWRILHIGGRSFKNTLWKDDNYLNPCRPQGGTWKFDRAGWAPGDLVQPWIVDTTGLLRPGQPITLKYEIQPYVNKMPVDGNPARHIIASQLILYKRPGRP